MSQSADVSKAFDPYFIARCQTALQELIHAVPDVGSAMVATADGFELASIGNAPNSSAISRLAALSSSLLAVSQASMREMRLTGPSTVLVENRDGKILVVEVTTQPLPTVLCVGAGHLAVTGKLLWAAKHCADALAQA